MAFCSHLQVKPLKQFNIHISQAHSHVLNPHINTLIAQVGFMSCGLKPLAEILCLSSTHWTFCGVSFSRQHRCLACVGKKCPSANLHLPIFRHTHTAVGHPYGPSCPYPFALPPSVTHYPHSLDLSPQKHPSLDSLHPCLLLLYRPH